MVRTPPPDNAPPPERIIIKEGEQLDLRDESLEKWRNRSRGGGGGGGGDSVDTKDKQLQEPIFTEETLKQPVSESKPPQVSLRPSTRRTPTRETKTDLRAESLKTFREKAAAEKARREQARKPEEPQPFIDFRTGQIFGKATSAERARISKQLKQSFRPEVTLLSSKGDVDVRKVERERAEREKPFIDFRTGQIFKKATSAEKEKISRESKQSFRHEITFFTGRGKVKAVKERAKDLPITPSKAELKRIGERAVQTVQLEQLKRERQLEMARSLSPKFKPKPEKLTAGQKQTRLRERQLEIIESGDISKSEELLRRTVILGTLGAVRGGVTLVELGIGLATNPKGTIKGIIEPFTSIEKIKATGGQVITDIKRDPVGTVVEFGVVSKGLGVAGKIVKGTGKITIKTLAKTRAGIATVETAAKTVRKVSSLTKDVKIVVRNKAALNTLKKLEVKLSGIKKDYKLWKINKEVQLESPFWKVRANAIKLENRLKAIRTDLVGRVGDKLGVAKNQVSSVVKGIRKQIRDDVKFYSGRRKAIFERVAGRQLRGLKGDLTNQFEWTKQSLSQFTKSQQAKMKTALKGIRKQIRDDVNFYGGRRRAKFDRLVGTKIRGLQGDLSNKAVWTGEALSKLVKKSKAKLSGIEKSVRTQVETDLKFFGSKRRAIFEKTLGRKLRGLKGDLTNQFEWKAESLSKFTKTQQVKLKAALKGLKKQIKDDITFFGSKRRAKFDRLIGRRIRGIKGDLSNKAFFIKEAAKTKVAAAKAKVSLLKETIKPIPKIIKQKAKSDLAKLKIAGFKKLPKGIKGAIRRAKAPKQLIPRAKLGRFTFFEEQFLKKAKPKNIDFWQQRAAQLKKAGFQKKVREILGTGDRDLKFADLPKSVQRIFKRAAVDQSPRGITETLRFIQSEFGKDFRKRVSPTFVKPSVKLLEKAAKVAKPSKIAKFKQVEIKDSRGQVQIVLQKVKVKPKLKTKVKTVTITKVKQVTKVVPKLKFKSLTTLLAAVGTKQKSKLSDVVGQVPGTALSQIPGQVQQFRQEVVPAIKQVSRTVQKQISKTVQIPKIAQRVAQREIIIEEQVQALKQVPRAMVNKFFEPKIPLPLPIFIKPPKVPFKLRKVKPKKGKPKPVLTQYTFTVVRPKREPRHLKFFTGAELR